MPIVTPACTRRSSKSNVGADAREERAFRRGAQAFRHLAQQRVADDVAEYVVDLAEAVEIEREERERLPGLARFFQHVREAVIERGAVRQVGQRIVVGEMLDARLGAL